MSDVAKWALLVAGAIVLLGLILALPFVEYINVDEFTEILATITETVGDFFRFARGLVNLFLLPFGRKILTGLMVWLFGKWAILMAIKAGVWVYHFIFK